MFSPHFALFIAMAAFIVACAIWLLIRIRRQTVWLPPLKVIAMEPSRLRRLVLKVPPWTPFLVFFLTGMTFLFFMLQPANKVILQIAPQSDRVHFFIDMSPSLSRYVTPDQLAAQVGKVWSNWEGEVKLSISTSHSGEVFYPQSKAEVEKLVASLGFHRAGVELGSALAKLKSQLEGVSFLLIFSDGDQASWQDFNWKYLEAGMDVSWIDVKTPQLASDNVYFRDIFVTSQPQDPVLEWDVEIERSGRLLARAGKLRGTLQGRNLLEIAWSLNEGQSRLTIPASIPIEQIESSTLPADAALVWQLEFLQPDMISLDNTFRTLVGGMRQNALLVAPVAGERMIEDPFFQLQSALEVIGFLPRRWDRYDESVLETSKFWIFGVDEERPLAETCPLPLAQRRIDLQRRKSQASDFPHVWLAPLVVETSYRNLCHCFYNLIRAERVEAKIPQLCQDVYDRPSLNALMRAWGASRLGGGIAEEQQGLSWFKEDKALGFAVTAFTLPLKPSKLTGMDHALFPLLIKNLVGWYGIRDLTENKSVWPRPVNLAQVVQWEKGDLDQKLRESNVPMGESLHSHLQASLLPKRWGGEGTLGQKQISLQREEKDPLPWLYVCLIVILSIMVLELLWHFGTHVRRRFSLLLLAGCFGYGVPSARAEIQVSVLSKQVRPLSLDRVAREISSRTSVDDFLGEPYFETRGENFRGEPWYWTAFPDRDMLVDRDGVLKPAFRSWLARGGFLILQGFGRDVLTQLTGKGFSMQRDQARWVPIPPDHELMRSFYLLEALPACQGEVWYGLQFDGRLAILAIPYDFLGSLTSPTAPSGACESVVPWEQRVRIFVNIIKVALTTDYKKDQVHMREILKRLR